MCHTLSQGPSRCQPSRPQCLGHTQCAPPRDTTGTVRCHTMTWVLRLWLGPTPPYLSHGILQRWAGLPPGARRGELTVPVHHWACHEAGEGVSPPPGCGRRAPVHRAGCPDLEPGELRRFLIDLGPPDLSPPSSPLQLADPELQEPRLWG